MDTNRTMKPIISLLGVGDAATTATTAHTFFRRSSSGVSFFNRHSPKKAIRSSEIRVPARDRVIDFGKHKGKMLGTVSSEYLRWMSKNLNTGDFEKWGKLAEDVLEDEVYADRMEWEVAEALLSGNREGVVASGCGVAHELEEISKRFGWDYHDKAGWSKVDFGLLGTSKGCRLPRMRVQVQGEEHKESNFKKPRCSGGGGGEREKRRERAAKKREQQIGARSNEEVADKNYNERKQEEDDKGSRRFPGRQYLIKKLGT